MKANSVLGRRNQGGFFGVGLGLALLAVFGATGWGLVTVVEEQQQAAMAAPEIHAAATDEATDSSAR